MIVQSLRLGELEVPEDKIIHMERPMLGFEHYTKYCLIEVDELNPFMLMQSVENPGVAFIVVNPLIFYPSYSIQINSQEIAELHVDDVRKVETYAVVTIYDEGPERTSVNLQGPVLINTENNKGKQLVLVNSKYGIQHLLTESELAQATNSEVSELDLATA